MALIRLRVTPSQRSLRGSVPLVADPDLLERAALWAALADGDCQIVVPHPPASWQPSLNALRTLGVQIEHEPAGRTRLRGRGFRGLSGPTQRVDVTGAPVLGHGLLGCLVAYPFACQMGPFESEAQLRADVETLSSRGGRAGLNADGVHLAGAQAALKALRVVLPSPNPLTKHMLLVSGLYADGETVISEPVVSADHSERMLDALGVRVECAGPVLRLLPPSADEALAAFEFPAPGSPTASAYLLVAAAIVAGSQVTLRHASLNPTRAKSLDALRALGARLGVAPSGQALNEPHGDVSLVHAPLVGGCIGGELALGLEHELHALAAAAAYAWGNTRFLDLSGMLSDQEIAQLLGFLRSFGVQAERDADGFEVQGAKGLPLRASRVTTGGDARLAALGVLLALGADGESVIDDVEALAEFLPKYVGTLRALGASLEVER